MDSRLTSDVRLSVSIVLYDSPVDLLLSTLDSLALAATYARNSRSLGEVEVVIVDNSPAHESGDTVRQALSEWPGQHLLSINYLKTQRNVGFGGGHNLALQGLDSDYHLILNPDAELAETILEVGLASLEEDTGIVLLSPEVCGDDGAQEFLCKRYPSVLVLLLRAFAPRFIRRCFWRRMHHYEMRDACTGPEEAEVMLASGCFMLVRTAALRAVGGFDERYLVYFEDFDLSLKMSGQGRVVYHPAMKIVHHGGYAARKGFWHVKLFVNSGIRFFQTHGWRWI